MIFRLKRQIITTTYSQKIQEEMETHHLTTNINGQNLQRFILGGLMGVLPSKLLQTSQTIVVYLTIITAMNTVLTTITTAVHIVWHLLPITTTHQILMQKHGLNIALNQARMRLSTILLLSVTWDCYYGMVTC